MKKLFTLLNCLLVYFFIAAQSGSAPAAADEDEGKTFSERIFLHTDKTSFIAGDTIWFKAYLFDGSQPGSYSTNFFIDLINEEGRVLQSQKLPVFGGTVYGNFNLPDSIAHGFYFLRSYTQLLLRTGNKAGAVKTIAILNPSNIPARFLKHAKPEYQVKFYPESGKMVSGILNTVAYKLTDQYGNTISNSGTVFNEAGDSVCSFTDVYDGMGSFSFTPAAEKYFAEIKLPDGQKKRFDLPAVNKEGLLLSVAENAKGKIFLVQKTEGLLNKPGETELVGMMFNKTVFNVVLKFENNESSGVIPVTNLSEGILNIAIVDKQKQVLAFRPVFIRKTVFQSPVLLTMDTINFSRKAKNVLSVGLTDFAQGNFSVSVTAWHPLDTVAGINRISDAVLLNAESQSVPVSKSSFNQLTGENNKYPDLVMLTGDWRIPPLTKQENTGVENKESGFISISGKTYKYATKKPITKGNLWMLMQTQDSSSVFLQTPVKADGSFSMNELVFDDSARFIYQMDDKKAGKPEVYLDEMPKTEKPISILPFIKNLPFDKMIMTDSARKKEIVLIKTYIQNVKDSSKLLEEVIVTARRRRPIDIINKRYTSGQFSSMFSAKVVDLINDPPVGGGNIFDYLQGRIAGLRIERRTGLYYSLTTSRAMSMTGGMIGVECFLNEMQVDQSALLSISLKEIAMVKYFPAGSNDMIGFGLSGKLAVYTKKMEDIKFDELSNNNIFYFTGYTPSQEFTNKDYATFNNRDKKDNRQTLYWNPNLNISSDEKEVKIQFYNSDNARKFKIVIQGFTYDGRVIDFEKIIE